MEFSIDRNELAVAVTHAVHGVPSNPLQPVYAGMLISVDGTDLLFAGSDSDVTFTAQAKATERQLNRPGDLREKITVPGKLFADIIKTLPDKEVHFTSYDSHAVLTCGRGEFKFQIYKDEYPSLPEPAEMEGGMDAEQFTSAVKQVTPACVRNDTSPVLSAIHLEPDDHDVWMVATDRYRLAAVRCPFTPAGMPGPALMPAWAAERLARAAAGTVTLGWDARVLTMACEGLTVTCRALQGTFPSWRKLLPTVPCEVEVDPKLLLAALRRAQLTGDEAKLTFTPGKLTVEAGQENHAEDVIDVTYNGNEFTALFGIPMLIDGLAGCEDTCRFGWSGSKVHVQSGEYTYTMQPRRPVIIRG